MSIGYACLTVGMPNTKLRSCIKKNATPDYLREIIEHNLAALKNQLVYNEKNQIKLFRISSDLIPFGSSSVNALPWDTLYHNVFLDIGDFAKSKGMRLSMHPGQYTVINSNRKEVIQSSVADLIYHGKILDAMGLDQSHKLVIHMGGIYGDKPQAMNRFCQTYETLGEGLKKRLVLENDDRLYTVEDILSVNKKINIPLVFDVLHHQVNPPKETEKDWGTWLSLCGETWKNEDGIQKIHYAQQDPLKHPGAHSSTIDARAFNEFWNQIKYEKPDIILEVKDKNLSVNKCMVITEGEKNIKRLEKEWSRYKYSVLEKDPEAYKGIRQLLKDKKSYPAIEFYALVDTALKKEDNVGQVINGIHHVWGYFKQMATEQEKSNFEKMVKGFSDGAVSKKAIKNKLFKMALKYEVKYLLDGVYFYI